MLVVDLPAAMSTDSSWMPTTHSNGRLMWTIRRINTFASPSVPGSTNGFPKVESASESMRKQSESLFKSKKEPFTTPHQISEHTASQHTNVGLQMAVLWHWDIAMTWRSYRKTLSMRLCPQTNCIILVPSTDHNLGSQGGHMSIINSLTGLQTRTKLCTFPMLHNYLWL